MKLTFDKELRHFLLELSQSGGEAPFVGELKQSPKWVSYQKKPPVFQTYDFREAAKFRKWADESTRKIFQRVLLKRYTLPSLPLPTFLDPHQVEGIRWVLTRSRAYLAHAPGAGKTLEVITASLWTEGEGQTLFIVPPSLAVNWEREIAKWLSTLFGEDASWFSVSRITDTERQNEVDWSSEFLIVPDSMLTKGWVFDQLKALPPLKLIAVDEASRFKEPTSIRTIALFGGKKKDFKSPGLIQRARHAVLLDGSPMPNRPIELWAPTFAMCPEAIDFMSEQQFGLRYGGATMNDYGQWEFKRSSHEAELKARLQKDFMHVVTEEKLNHPERLRSIIYMDKDPRSADMKKWEAKVLRGVDLNRLPEFENQGDIASYRAELGIRKVDWAASYIRERLQSGESVLVFAWHRDVCLELFRIFKNSLPGIVMGGTAAQSREVFFQDFQAGKMKLIIGNIAAMGRGHNLQRADRVVFVEYSWTDELNLQCEKRASRKGRAKDLPVKSDYLVVPHSIDETVLTTLFTKQSRVKRVIG